MKTVLPILRKTAEAAAAAMMALMFLTFILQILIRYSARLSWVAETFPFLDPTLFGWTLEFCLALWVWLIFWGNAFVVRERDHVTFDMLYNHVRPGVRKWFAIFSALAICIGLLWSLEPTWGKFYFLRLKKTATLHHLFGDWIRMRHVFSVYALFVVVVAARYAWRAWHVARHGAHVHGPDGEGATEE